MTFVRRFFGFLVEVFKLALAATIPCVLVLGILTSGWHYAIVDGQEKRCFSVCLPGVLEYTDWEHGEPAIRRTFSLRATYRLGPWIDPEWVDAPVEDTDAE